MAAMRSAPLPMKRQPKAKANAPPGLSVVVEVAEHSLAALPAGGKGALIGGLLGAGRVLQATAFTGNKEHHRAY